MFQRWAHYRNYHYHSPATDSLITPRFWGRKPRPQEKPRNSPKMRAEWLWAADTSKHPPFKARHWFRDKASPAGSSRFHPGPRGGQHPRQHERVGERRLLTSSLLCTTQRPGQELLHLRTVSGRSLRASHRWI